MNLADVIHVSSLSVRYGDDLVFRDVSFSVGAGRSVAVIGPSGCGKSTLLRCCLGLLAPAEGALHLEGEQTSGWNQARWRDARLHTIGFVPQDAPLINELTAGENVELPMLLAGVRRAQARRRAKMLFETVGLAGFYDRFPAAISGGQRQRVALVRALANEPRIVLADEATGSLDRRAAGRVADLLFEPTLGGDRALVLVTHDEALAARADSIVCLEDGRRVERQTQVP